MRFVLGRRSSDAGGSVFSKLAAGVSLTPLKDLAFAAADAFRTAFFGSGKTLVGHLSRPCRAVPPPASMKAAACTA